MKKMKQKKSKEKRNLNRISNMMAAAIFLAAAILAFTMYRRGFFQSVESIQNAVDEAGIAGVILFLTMQVLQSIFPVIPGGITCTAGVVLFGPLRGFLFNYIGICAGSCTVFAISKYLGRDLMTRIFSPKLIERYESWMDEQKRFTKLFTIAIVLPFAPDDFLCYLAGTTSMKWKQFLPIILLGKPLSVAAYSVGLYTFLEKILIAWKNR